MPTIGDYIDAMTEGLERNAGLISALLPRVSPEYGVVAAATDGLLTKFPELRIVLEKKSADYDGKCDMIIDDHLLLEFKVLWSLGFKECVAGVTADRAKLMRALAANREGAAIVFCYEVANAGAFKDRESDTPLETTIIRAMQPNELGPPLHRAARTLSFTGRGIQAQGCLVAWAAAPKR